MVRSSYRAGEFFLEAMIRGERAGTAGATGGNMGGSPPAARPQPVVVGGKAVQVPDFW